MLNHISIDVTNAKECAVPKDKFRIIDFSGVVGGKDFMDLVHNGKPYFHFQILHPKDQEQHDKAVAYFNENKKVYVGWVNSLDLLLYVGCTNNVYIKSGVADFETEELKNILPQAAHWYRFYGHEQSEISK